MHASMQGTDLPVSDEVLPWLTGPDDEPVDQEGFLQAIKVAASVVPQIQIQEALSSIPVAGEDSYPDELLPSGQESVEVEDFAIIQDATVAPDSPLAPCHPENFTVSKAYLHPSGCRSYLKSSVVPILHQGLVELVAEMEEQRLSEAAGVGLEDGMYLPKGWKPFLPYRWLANWLMAHKPEVPSEEYTTKSSYSMKTSEDKASLIFKSLDVLEQGFIPASALCTKLGFDRDLVISVLSEAGHPEESTVDSTTFVSLLLSLIDGEESHRLDEAVHAALGYEMLQLCTSAEDKFKFAFLALDGKHGRYTQTVSADEILNLTQRLGLDNSSAISALDGIGKGTDAQLTNDPPNVLKQLSSAEFIAALMLLAPASSTSKQQLDRLVSAAVHQSQGLPLTTTHLGNHHDPVSEVHPPELAQHVRALPSFSTTSWASTSEVIDAVEHTGQPRIPPLVLIDVRTTEEIEVSAIPGAIHVPSRTDESAPTGWTLDDVSQLTSGIIPPDRQALVVAYCSTGERSSAVAASLGALLGGIEVRSLCGGILSYYNEGGNVKAPDGHIVQAVHPGESALKGLVTRGNAYRTPSE